MQPWPWLCSLAFGMAAGPPLTPRPRADGARFPKQWKPYESLSGISPAAHIIHPAWGRGPVRITHHPSQLGVETFYLCLSGGGWAGSEQELADRRDGGAYKTNLVALYYREAGASSHSRQT